MATGPGGGEQLEADLGHAEPRLQQPGQPQGLDEVVDVEGQGQVVTGVGHGILRLVGGADQLADAGDALGLAPSLEPGQHLGRAPADRRRSPCRPAPPMLRPAAARRRRRAAATPPTPTMGSSGMRGVHVVDGPHGHRVDRRPRQAAAAGRRAPAGGRSTSMAMPSTVFTSVTASAPASAAAAAISGRSATFGLSLAHRGRPAAAVAATAAAGRASASGRTCAGGLEVRAAQVDLHGHDRRRGRRQHLGRGGELVDGATPDRGHDARPVATSGGQLVGQPVLDAGALQADGVQHPRGRRVQARRRVARPRRRAPAT